MNVKDTRFLLVVPSLAGGGAEFVARTWADTLASRDGTDITMALTHPSRNDLAEVGIDLYDLSVKGYLRKVSKLRKALLSERYDCVVALLPYSNLLVCTAALGLKHRPLVLISGRNMVIPLLHVHDIKFRLKQVLAKFLYRTADGFIAISHPVAAEAAALYGIRQRKIWVLRNPACAKKNITGPDSSAKRVTDGGSSSGATVELVVPARVVPQKRPLFALDVASYLADNFAKRVRITYFGTGDLVTEVRSAAERRGIEVEFKYSDRWFDHCPEGAVVLLPSISEGFGNVLIEAAMVGMRSVAVSSALGVADAIIPGVTGELVTIDSAAAVASAVVEAAGKGTCVAPSEWLERFTPDASADSLLDIYMSALQTRVTTGKRRWFL